MGEGDGLAVDGGVGALAAVSEAGDVFEADGLAVVLGGVIGEALAECGVEGGAAGGATGFAVADLDGVAGGFVLGEGVVELGGGADVLGREVEL